MEGEAASLSYGGRLERGSRAGVVRRASGRGGVMQDSFVGNGDMEIEVYGEGMGSGKVRNRGVGGVAREVIVKCAGFQYAMGSGVSWIPNPRCSKSEGPRLDSSQGVISDLRRGGGRGGFDSNGDALVRRGGGVGRRTEGSGNS